ncbi:MAG: hypothetical protein H6985_17695 [Pseudomonadales bacterium]|nr:hypothetical protein [Halioglobus sp.]MCP5131401.1 hypothetical protein [Pseudomonadales bacterium]
MEKLVYALWPASGLSADGFRDDLLAGLGPQLTQREEVHGVRLAVADSAVAPAAARRMESHPPLPCALLSLWVDAAESAAWEPLIDRYAERRSGYLVVEAEPLVSHRLHPAAPGQRVHGMCQVVFFRKPAQLDRNDWLAIWQGSHTRVAIETQSTFGYRQNLVVRALDDGALPCDAVVEENFPPGAMASDHEFYASGGDDALLQQRMTAMFESCGRFIDFEHIDVIPMSEYLIKPLAAP